MRSHKVIVISGPTASGKTDISLELAERFGGEIVNFDSLLLYKEITIGTAKPTKDEQKRVNHHMVDVSSIAEPLNAADYAKQATPIIEELHRQGKTVYLVGGSGFYLQAVLKGMYDSPTTPKEIIERSDRLYDAEGITPFLISLKENDFESFQRYHENDHYRIRRAVEHFWNTGTKLSLAREKKDQENTQLGISQHNWDTLNIYLNLPREEHWPIIEQRTKKMLQSGLIEEVSDLLKRGFSGEEKPLSSIGYKETISFIKKEILTLEELEEQIVIHTRQLAKSQRTWFNRDHSKMEFHPLTQREELFKRVDEFIKK
ncbi:MAG: tRNA (adenosine(37)-N6)-dimethylallyltransferase MiaA [Bacteriovoracaceae bacterium]